MLKLERHSLLILNERGQTEAKNNRIFVFDHDAAIWDRFPDLPAIYTGRRGIDGFFQVGFSYPVREDARRVRIASTVSSEGIAESCTPWELATRARKSDSVIGEQMRSVAAIADAAGLRLGLFGAAAMELATGYTYLHRDSDLDLLVDRASYRRLLTFYDTLSDWEYESRHRTDVELRLSKNRYCKLRELLREQSTILCRGGEEPVLLSRRAALEMLDADDIVF